jgi:hypothetical protein
MQPKKVIPSSKELEAEKPQLIKVPTQPPPNERQTPRIYSPDELDSIQRRAEQQANGLLANAELQEIGRKGILPPDAADNPYSIPNPNYGFNHKVVFPHRYRLLTITAIILLIGFLLALYSQYTYTHTYSNPTNQQTDLGSR